MASLPVPLGRLRPQKLDTVHHHLTAHNVLIDALDRAYDTCTRAQKWRGPTDLPDSWTIHNTTLAATVLAVLAAGPDTDPTRDPDVVRLVVAEAVKANADAVQHLAGDAYVAALTAHSPDVVAKLNKPFLADVKILQAAAKKLGPDIDLSDDSAILTLNLRDVALPARDASDRIRATMLLLHELDQLQSGLQNGHEPSALHIADINLDQWHALCLADLRPDALVDPYPLAVAGVRFSLANHQETKARRQQLEHQQQLRSTAETEPPEPAMRRRSTITTAQPN